MSIGLNNQKNHSCLSRDHCYAAYSNLYGTFLQIVVVVVIIVTTPSRGTFLWARTAARVSTGARYWPTPTWHRRPRARLGDAA